MSPTILITLLAMDPLAAWSLAVGSAHSPFKHRSAHQANSPVSPVCYLDCPWERGKECIQWIICFVHKAILERLWNSVFHDTEKHIFNQ